jgi:hypothetical protein
MTRLMKQDMVAEQKGTIVRNDWKDPNAMKNPPFTATGFCVEVVRVLSVSYLTACNDTFKSLKMYQIYQAVWTGSVYNTICMALTQCAVILTAQSYDLNFTHLQ